jgi:hypothetical protein
MPQNLKAGTRKETAIVLAKKIPLYCLAVALLALGLAIATKVAWGSDSTTTFLTALGVKLGITIGTIGTNQKLTFRRALFRSISVNVIGMGCLLFPVCLITITFSYYLLTKRGITIWDAQSLTLPLQVRKTTFGHYAAAAIIMYTMAQVAGYSLLYTPGAFETIEQVSPDTAKQLREIMPNLPGAKSKPSSGTTPQPLQ